MEPSRRVPAKSAGVAQTLHLQIHVKKKQTTKNSARGSWEAFMLMLICPGSGAQVCLRSLGGITLVWCSPGPVSFPPWTTCGQSPPHPLLMCAGCKQTARQAGCWLRTECRCERLPRIVMKVFSQVSTIPGGPEKQKLVLYCSYKRTAAQYLAISLLSQNTLPSVTKPPGVGQVSHRQWASG